MKYQHIFIAAMVALAGCSKAEEGSTGKIAAAEDQVGPVSHAKPQLDQAKKRSSSPNVDALFKRSREEAEQRHQRGGDKL